MEGISEQMPDHQPFTAGMVDLVVEYRYICSSVHSSFGQFTLEFSLAGFTTRTDGTVINKSSVSKSSEKRISRKIETIEFRT